MPAFWSRGCIFPHGSSGMAAYVHLVGVAAIYSAIQTPMVRAPSMPRVVLPGGTHPSYSVASWLQSPVNCDHGCSVPLACAAPCRREHLPHACPIPPWVQLLVFPSLGGPTTAVLDWLVNARLVAIEPALHVPPMCARLALHPMSPLDPQCSHAAASRVRISGALHR